MKRNKKDLYESIMTSVAKEVKKALNELSSETYNNAADKLEKYLKNPNYLYQHSPEYLERAAKRINKFKEAAIRKDIQDYTKKRNQEINDLVPYDLKGLNKQKQIVDIELNDEIRVNGRVYVDLGLPSGNLWAKYNVGVNQNNLSTKNAWKGNYYAWGETYTKDIDKYSYLDYEFIPDEYKNGDNEWDLNHGNEFTKYDEYSRWCYLELEDDAAHANTPEAVMPTREDFYELKKYTDSKWITNYSGVKGLNGCLFTSKNNDNELFFPAAGHKHSEWELDDFDGRWETYGKVHNDNEYGYYWTNATNNVYSGLKGDLASSFKFGIKRQEPWLDDNYSDRCDGLSVRGVIHK